MTDQAHKLRVLAGGRERSTVISHSRDDGRPYVVAVTSGKGGVGKTSVAVNLAILLAKFGEPVTLFDADLGLSNVDVLLGLDSRIHLGHVLSGAATIREAVAEGPCGVKILTAGSGLRHMADLDQAARQEIIDRVIRISDGAGFLLIDTSPGIAGRVVDFVNAADEAIVVTTSDPASMADSYAAVKTIARRSRDLRIGLLVNQASNGREAERVANGIDGISRRFLGKPLDSWWMIPRDTRVEQSAGEQQAFVLEFPMAPAAGVLSKIAGDLRRRAAERHTAKKERRHAS